VARRPHYPKVADRNRTSANLFRAPALPLWYNARRLRQRAKGASSLMTYIHAIAEGHLEWALYGVSLLVSALPGEFLLILMRGFGRRGFGFGRGRGIFRLFRIFRLIRFLFVLLFTTILGPIVLVVLIAFAAYAFFSSRRGR
jgi:hypothetical protein